MSDGLKPCPHCGSVTAPEISNCVDLETCGRFEECAGETSLCVVCSVHNGGCGASGGFAANEDGAISKWNARSDRACGMNRVLLYDEMGIEGIECDECGWSDIHPWDEPLPERCPGCKATVVG